MPNMTRVLKEAWERREGPVVLTSVGSDGNPNNIYATEVGLRDDNKIVIANKFIDRTMKNRLPDSEGSVIFVTNDKKSYIVKGEVSYEYGGENFKFMKSWSKDKHPGHGAAVVSINTVYEEGTKIL